MDYTEHQRRLEFLRLARLELNEEYLKKRNDLHKSWQSDSQAAWLTQGKLLPYPVSTSFFPTEQEVVAKALELYNQTLNMVPQPTVASEPVVATAPPSPAAEPEQVPLPVYATTPVPIIDKEVSIEPNILLNTTNTIVPSTIETIKDIPNNTPWENYLPPPVEINPTIPESAESVEEPVIKSESATKSLFTKFLNLARELDSKKATGK